MALDDGATRRHHLLAAARQTGKKPQALEGPPFPEGLRYLWRHFLDIHAGRTVNGMGHTRATHLDVWAWQQNTGTRLEPWEIRTISALGSIWMKTQIDADNKRAASQGNRH